jgi:hypothetical protein
MATANSGLKAKVLFRRERQWKIESHVAIWE